MKSKVGFLSSLATFTLLVFTIGPSSAIGATSTNTMFSLNASDPGSYTSSSPTIWNDLSTSNRDGTINGTLTYDSANGALKFPGSSASYVDMGSGFSDFGTGITIEFEAHFGPTLGSYERIFDFGRGAALDNIWVGNLGNTSQLAIEVFGPNPTSQGSYGTCVTAAGLNALAANTFAKFVITLDGSKCRIYKNGVQLDTEMAYGNGNDANDLGTPYPKLPANVTRTQNYLGKSNWAADAAFDGAIKYLRIYNTALTATEVTTNSTSYTLTYSATGSTSGTAPVSQTGNGFVTLATNSGTLAKTGHTFAGWASSANQTSGTTGSYNLVASTTLYPAFTPNSYSVTYVENGGSAVSDGSFTYGGSLTYPSAPTRAGYTFLGWFAGVSGGSARTASSVAADNVSVTLHAQWSANTYNVSYDEHGGTIVADDSYIFGNSVTYPTAPTKTGYTFQGWFDAASGGTALSSATISARSTNSALHAQWAANTYNVTYDEHGGTTVADGSYAYGNIIAFPAAPTKEGQTFLGWFASASGGTSLTELGISAGTNDVALHAQWSANTYNVTYDEHGGTIVADGSYIFGNSVTYPTAPTKTGYTFQGWFDAASGGTALSSATISARSTNSALHAQWSANTYNVTYDEHGGTTVADGSYVYGNVLTYPTAPTKLGHTFQGWFASANGGSALSELGVSGGAEDVTLHAQWSANTYNVSYDVHGGTTVAEGSYVYGSNLAYPRDPTKSGSYFLGWFANVSGGSSLSALDVSSGTEDVTLHAQWHLLDNQTVTWLPTTTSLTLTQSPFTPDSLATSDAGGAISYTIGAAGTTGCSVNALSGALSFSGVGTCIVTATAAATSTHLAGTRSIEFEITSTSAMISFSLDASTGTAVENSTLDYAASGLKANSDWSIVLRSTPQILDSGTFSGSMVSGQIRIPAGLEAGWHSITFTGLKPNGSAITKVVYFEVRQDGTLIRSSSSAPATSGQTNTGLAATGSDLYIQLKIALALLAIGALFLLNSRRRILR